MSDPEELASLVSKLRPHLRNVIGVTIGKGGEGKTTVSTNIAYMLADQQRMKAEEGKSAKPILYIELDSNGNGRMDFGILGKEVDDDGLGFVESLTEDKPLTVAQGVRPYLDMVVSGSHIADIPTAITKLADKHSLSAYLMLALLLAQISHRYRWIILDFSPGDKSIQRLGLAACTHLVSPMKGSDNAVITGLGTLASLVRQNRRLNAEVGIAAIVFLGYRKVNEAATSELVLLREKIHGLLEPTRIPREVVIEEFIRDGRSTATLARNHGMPTKEFALAAAGQLTDQETGELVSRPRDETGRLVDPQRPVDMATDYAHVTAAVIRQVLQRNAKLQGAER
ncbi:ParA family protein [Streptomyces sp. NPDC051133]|uniref:ParA family protein n=1 Tax=Streptomyces sp. NPDC051133 TaxID=3155521 RepID=UPI0034169B9F